MLSLPHQDDFKTRKEYLCYLQLIELGYIYIFAPQRRFDNKQWLCKHKAMPVITKRKKAQEKFQMPYFFNSNRPIVPMK